MNDKYWIRKISKTLGYYYFTYDIKILNSHYNHSPSPDYDNFHFGSPSIFLQ